MYKRGDYILFSMRARIADTVYDPAYGECYIVECENPGTSIIRVPVGNVDMRYVPTVKKQFPGQTPPPTPVSRSVVQYRRGLECFAHEKRPPSPNDVYVHGMRQGGLTSAEWTEQDLMSPQHSPRQNRRAAEYGCPQVPEWYDNDFREQKG